MTQWPTHRGICYEMPLYLQHLLELNWKLHLAFKNSWRLGVGTLWVGIFYFSSDFKSGKLAVLPSLSSVLTVEMAPEKKSPTFGKVLWNLIFYLLIKRTEDSESFFFVLFESIYLWNQCRAPLFGRTTNPANIVPATPDTPNISPQVRIPPSSSSSLPLSSLFLSV